jgi:uncharacterized protein
MDADDTMLPLTAAEARVLGCLIEKQATTPDVYPLTVNAAQSAANQKTGAVHHALRTLERKGLAKQMFSSRAERYEHRAEAGLGLPRPQVALLALLLLRGAQTAHELLARSERLHAFADTEDVRHHLDRLSQRTPALVALLPRTSGQREDRFAQLLSGEASGAIPPTARPGGQQAVISSNERQALEARVVALEAEVVELRAHIVRLLDGGAK